MTTPTRPVVVLIGPPAAGKSRIGKKIAKYLQHDFIDTDRWIVAEHGPIADIFASRGEPEFRRIEREAVARALATDAVVSLGGGAVLDDRTRGELGSQRVVLLTVSADAVAKRLSGQQATGQKRPLLAADSATDAVESWKRLVEARREVYESLATASWDTSVRPITAIAREIADWATTDRAGAEQR